MYNSPTILPSDSSWVPHLQMCDLFNTVKTHIVICVSKIQVFTVSFNLSSWSCQSGTEARSQLRPRVSFQVPLAGDFFF